MFIVLDSNIIIQDYRLKSKLFGDLVSYISLKGYTLVVPTIVIDEVINHLKRELFERYNDIERFNSYWKKFSQKRLIDKIKIKEEIEKEVDQYRKYLIHTLDSKKALYVDYNGVDIKEIVSAIVERKPPIKSKGEGIGDLLVWEAVKECVLKKGDTVFITENIKDFAGTDYRPKEELLKEIEGSPYSIELHKGIFNFLSSKTIDIERIDIEWIKSQPSFIESLENKAELVKGIRELLTEFFGNYHMKIKSIDFVKITENFDEYYYAAENDYEYEIVINFHLVVEFIYEYSSIDYQQKMPSSDIDDSGVAEVELIRHYTLREKILLYDLFGPMKLLKVEGYEMDELAVIYYEGVATTSYKDENDNGNGIPNRRI